MAGRSEVGCIVNAEKKWYNLRKYAANKMIFLRKNMRKKDIK